MVAGHAIRWLSAEASVIGASHLRKGLPNQDRYAVSKRGGATLSAVSDGHTSAARAERGAQFAVDEAVRIFERGEVPSPIPRQYVHDLFRQLITGWQALVAADLVADPIDAAGDPVREYGCTLSIVIATDAQVVGGQIGDGDVLVGGEGWAGHLIAPDPDLVGDVTYSLCLDDPIRFLRVGHVTLESDPIDTVIVATDGFANSFVDAAWPGQVIEDYRTHLADSDIDGVRHRLAAWLTASAESAGDDTTVVILYRRAGPPGPSRPMVGAVSAGTDPDDQKTQTAEPPLPDVDPADQTQLFADAVVPPYPTVGRPGSRATTGWTRALVLAVGVGVVCSGLGFVVGRATHAPASTVPGTTPAVMTSVPTTPSVEATISTSSTPTTLLPASTVPQSTVPQSTVPQSTVPQSATTPTTTRSSEPPASAGSKPVTTTTPGVGAVPTTPATRARPTTAS